MGKGRQQRNLRRRYRRQPIPGWMLSLAIHVSLLFLLAKGLPWTAGGQGGLGKRTSGEFGILAESFGDPAKSAEPRGTAVAVTISEGPAASPVTAAIPRRPLSGLAPARPLGPGPNAQASAPLPAVGGLATGGVMSNGGPLGSGSPDVVAAGETLAAGRGGGEGSGGTGNGLPGASFMGTKDYATKVVFVIDCSGSMIEHNAIRVAKSSLVASLNSLLPTQSYQIIFFNEKTQLLMLKGEDKPGLYQANDINKTLTRQQINSVQPEFGTNREKAIVAAIKLKPDVIFLLTDIGAPELWPADLKRITDLNKASARIHTFEFGEGPDLNLSAGNFLRRLSGMNGGTHRYFDITRFGKPQEAASSARDATLK